LAYNFFRSSFFAIFFAELNSAQYSASFDTYNDFLKKKYFWVIFAFFANFEPKRDGNGAKK